MSTSWTPSHRLMESSTQGLSPHSDDGSSEQDVDDEEGRELSFESFPQSTLPIPADMASLPQDHMLFLEENVELTKQLDSAQAERHNLQQQLADTREELNSTRSTLQQQIESLRSQLSSRQANSKLSDVLPVTNDSFHFFSPRKYESTKDEIRTLKGQLQVSKDRQALLEEELVAARENAVTTNEHLEESKRQYGQIQREVEATEASEGIMGTKTKNQVALLQTQRRELAQRVLQLLTINGKFRSSSVTLRHRIEIRDSKIEALKQEVLEAKDDGRMNEVILQRQILEWQNRAQTWEQECRETQQALAVAKKRSLRCDYSSLEHRIKELESENEILLDQQNKQQYTWDHQKSLMRRNISALEEKIQQLESQLNFCLEPNEKRDQPPSKAMCRDDNTQIMTVDHSSFSTSSPSFLTVDNNLALPSTNGNPSGFSILHDRLEQTEARLREKEARESELTEQLSELSRSAQKAQEDVELAEERVQLLQTYLDVSVTSQPRKARLQEENIVESVTMIEEQQQLSRRQSEQMQQRLQQEKTNMSARHKARLERVRALDHTLLISEHGLDNSFTGRSRSILPMDEKDVARVGDRGASESLTIEEGQDLRSRCENLEQQCSALGTENVQLKDRSEEQVKEIATMKARLLQLDKENNDRAEAIIAFEKQIQAKIVEFDVAQMKAAETQDELQGSIVALMSDKAQLTNRFDTVATQLSHSKALIAELTTEKETLEKESQAFSDLKIALQAKIRTQENDLALHRDRLVLLEEVSAEQMDRIGKLQTENEWLMGEIKITSDKSRDQSTQLSTSCEEVEVMRHELKLSREANSRLQTEHDKTTKELLSLVQELECMQKEALQERASLLQQLEDTKLLREDLNKKEFRETSLSETNETQRHLEDSLGLGFFNMKGDLESSRAEILVFSEAIATVNADQISEARNDPRKEATNNQRLDLQLQLKLEEENASLRLSNAEKEMKLNDVLAICKQQEERIESVTHEFTELQLHSNALKAENFELKSGEDKRFDTACAQLNELESLVNELQGEMATLENERDDLALQVDTQKKWLDSALSQLNDLEDNLLVCQDDFETSQLRVRALEGKLNTLEAKSRGCVS